MKYHNRYPVLLCPLLRKYKFGRDTAFITQNFGENALGWYQDWGIDGHDAWDIQTKGLTQWLYHNILGFFTGDRVSAKEEGGAIPIQATHDGTVTFAGTWVDGGKRVMLMSDELTIEGRPAKLETIYHHLDSYRVKEGQKVTAGVILGRAGNTGKYTTGAHLHFVIRPHWKMPDGSYKPDLNNGFYGAVNPLKYMTDGTIYQKGMMGHRQWWQYGIEVTQDQLVHSII